MAWKPNRALGYAMWSSARCVVCDATAHYRVGRNGYCKRHKALADGALRAARINGEIASAIIGHDADERDKRMKKEDLARKHNQSRKGFK